jgi:hypothetical protein
MNQILSYKGLMASNSMERILLSTKKGEKGYRIRKLQTITDQPSAYDVEGVLQIFKDTQTSVTAGIDFSDNRLIAISYSTFGNQPYEVSNSIVLFDQEIFNQDIHITYIDAGGNNRPMNYYLELEVIMLNETEATVATLKDIRNNQ